MEEDRNVKQFSINDMTDFGNHITKITSGFNVAWGPASVEAWFAKREEKENHTVLIEEWHTETQTK